MNAVQNGFRGGWRRIVVLLVAAGAVLTVGVSGLFAEGPDSTKQGLREGIFVPRDTTKRLPSPVALEALQRLNENSVKKWSVDWDQGSGLPHWMGGLTDKQYDGQPSDAAKAFALEHLNLLTGIADSQALANYSVEILNAKSFNVFTMVGLQVYYKVVKIHDGMLSIDVSNDKRIGSVTNSLRSVSLDNVTPTLSKADVEEVIRRLAAPDTAETGDGKMELVIYPSSPARLAYYGFRKINGWTWGFVLDANTGEAIRIGRLGHMDGKPAVRFGNDAKQHDVSSDSTSRGPLPMLPAEPMRRVPDPEKRGLDRDSGGKPSGSSALKSPTLARSHPPKGTSLPLNPNSLCWFFDVNFLPGADEPRLSTGLVLESTGDSK